VVQDFLATSLGRAGPKRDSAHSSGEESIQEARSRVSFAASERNKIGSHHRDLVFVEKGGKRHELKYEVVVDLPIKLQTSKRNVQTVYGMLKDHKGHGSGIFNFQSLGCSKPAYGMQIGLCKRTVEGESATAVTERSFVLRKESL